MKIRAGLFAVSAALLIAAPSLAQPAPAQEIAGTWQGTLQVDPTTAMTIQFVFTKRADGSYSAVLNSPDNDTIKNLATDSVAWKTGTLTVKVAALSGEFDGTLEDATLAGLWKQPGSTLPLVLRPYQKPVMSKSTISTLTGSWVGPVTGPGGIQTFVARFKADDEGGLQGSLSVPEVNATLPVANIEFVDNKLAFKVPAARGGYEATLADGVLTGVWRQVGLPPAGLPVTLKKGEYTAKVVVLKMPTESFGRVAGTWNGDLHTTGPQGAITLPIVLRFETNQHADMVAFVDSPSQHSSGIPVNEAELTADKLMIRIDALHGNYAATLSGNSLTGTWTQGPNSMPLTLTRK